MGPFIFQGCNLCVVLRLTRRGDECPGGAENERHRLQRCTCAKRWLESLGDVRLPGRSDLANEKFFGIILSLKLIGTAIADDPELSMAIIEIRGTRQQSYFREKDWVGGVRIKKILRNRLIVDYGKKEVNVAMLQSLPGENETSAFASAPMADQGSVERTASFRLAGNRESIAGRVTGRQNFVHLDRTEVETSLADVDQAHCMLKKMVLFAKLQLWI